MNLLDLVFGKKKKKIQEQQNSDGFVIQISNSSITSLGESANPELNNTVLACINKIALSIASTRLISEHRNTKGEVLEIRNLLTDLLTIEPNSRMSAFDMWYKTIAICLIKNESWIWCVRDEDTDEIVELIPLNSRSESLLTPKEYPKELYVKFNLADGSTPVIPERDLIHIRNIFINGEYFAEKNKTLKTQVSINDDVWKNVIEWSKNSAVVRGALVANGVMKEEDMKKHAEKFREQFLTSQNSGGVIVVDSKFTYKDISTPTQTLTADQLKQTKEAIFDYYGLNEDIIRNAYDSAQWLAFYHGYLEPFFIRIENELNRKLTTRKERSFGRRFRFVVDDMEHMSPTEKINAMTFMVNIGAMSRNEVRGKWRLAPIEGGDTYLYSKNYAEVGMTDETSDGRKDSNTTEEESVNIDINNDEQKEGEENAEE